MVAQLTTNSTDTKFLYYLGMWTCLQAWFLWSPLENRQRLISRPEPDLTIKGSTFTVTEV